MTGVKGRKPPVTDATSGWYAPDDAPIGAIPYKGANGLILWLTPGAAATVVKSNGLTPNIPSYQADADSGGGGGGTEGADVAPTSPNAADDEWNGASLDTTGGGADATRHASATPWAWVNQGGATATLTNGVLRLKSPASATPSFRIIKQALPGGNWTYEAHCGLVTKIANHARAGVVLRNSSSGKLVAFSSIYTNGSGLACDRWSSPTAFNATVLTTVAASVFPYEFYLQISYDGTTFTMSFSRPGLDYCVHTTEAKATYISSADEIGLFANSENSADVSLISKWFRRTA